jgi:hypothetical protein
MANCKDPNLTYVSGEGIDCNDPKYDCLKWSDTDCVKWSDNPYTWGDCILIEEVVPPTPPDGNGVVPWEPPTWVTSSCDDLDGDCLKKKKRLIQLICYVRDQEIVEEKDIEDMTICIEDVELVKKDIEKKLTITFD